MMDFNIIECARSQYINPLVTVVKKDGSVRLCLDARTLNSVMLSDYEGTLPIHELLKQCSGTKIMSSMIYEVASGRYHCLPTVEITPDLFTREGRTASPSRLLD